MLIIGIDPGITGAVAAVTPSGTLQWVVDMPIRDAGKQGRKANEIDGVMLARLLRVHAADIGEVWCEEVQALPSIGRKPDGSAGHGALASFSLGDSRGCIRGVCEALGLSVQRVRPQAWKKLYGLNSDKEAARACAVRLCPGCEALSRKKDHGRAEAILIARYGAHQSRLGESFLAGSEARPALTLVSCAS